LILSRHFLVSQNKLCTVFYCRKTLSIHTFPDSPLSQCHFSDYFSLVLPQKISFTQTKSFQSQIKLEYTSGQEKRSFRHGKSPETMKAVAQAASQSAATTSSPVRFRQQVPPHSQGPQRGFLYTSSCRHRSPPRQQLASQQLGTSPHPGPPYLHYKIILETNPSPSSLLIIQSNRGNAAPTRLRKS
jgi:hypothetical protein